MSLQIRHVATTDVVVVSPHEQLVGEVTKHMADDETTVTRGPWAAGLADAPAAWGRPDVTVLDDRDEGDTVQRVHHLRRRWPTLLVAVVNVAYEQRCAALLDEGADDAVAAGSPMIAARLRALARRARAVNASARIAIGDVVFEREARRVWCDRQEVQLSPREFAVLDCLFYKAPHTVSSVDLADYVWGDAGSTPRRGAVEVYIGYLRKKLASSRTVVIGTVRGEGYRFEPRA